MARSNDVVLVIAVACVLVFVALVIASTGAMSSGDMKVMCLIQGGIPIEDRDGRLTRCDFPLNLGRIR